MMHFSPFLRKFLISVFKYTKWIVFFLLLVAAPVSFSAQLVEEAKANIAAGKFAQALDNLNALELDARDSPEAHFLRALVSINLGQFEDAIATLENLIRQQPENGAYNALLGRAL